ncbi:hypothetical protein LIER_22356 [Lithospermum erythrorhizon]|uniref:Uncharacterized protein n=1 Tax=Lithospermum erythrorhizon TaxID=34254 RepID=A0AAV3QW47_LITER
MRIWTEVDYKDADVGGDESKSEIPTKANVVDETITPIVEEGVEHSSCAEGAANLSEHSVVPSDTDFMGKTVMPPNDGGEEARPTVIDTVNDPVMVETATPSVRDTAMEDDDGMTSMDVPSAGSTEDVTAGKGDVTPSVADKSAGVVGLSEERAEPTTGDGVANTLNTEDVEFDEAAS